MNALAQEIGADKSPAEDYILGGSDAPEVTDEMVKYPATETYRPLETQPLAQAPVAVVADLVEQGGIGQSFHQHQLAFAAQRLDLLR